MSETTRKSFSSLRKHSGAFERLSLAIGIAGTLLLAAGFAETLFPSPPTKTHTKWHGFKKQEFVMDARGCYVVFPKSAAPGRPWIWRARFPNYHPKIDATLLAKGFHIAYMDVAGLYGCPRAVEHWDKFYKHVLGEFHLARKMTLEGVSRGGLIVYNWAARNPDKVNAIYCESPVCDLKSWPGGRGAGLGSPNDWTGALAAYGFTEVEMLRFRGNPVDHLEPLAKARVPVLHVVCDQDQVVPPEENTDVLYSRYTALGGPMMVFRNMGKPQTLHGHHFPLDDPEMVVDFVLRHTPGTAQFMGAGEE